MGHHSFRLYIYASFRYDFSFLIYVKQFLMIYQTIAFANLGFSSMLHDLNCTEFQATIGLSVYTLGFAIVPLVTASFSEEFGPQLLYLVYIIGFTFMYMIVAL